MTHYCLLKQESKRQCIECSQGACYQSIELVIEHRIRHVLDMRFNTPPRVKSLFNEPKHGTE
jgi:hypothetical protein